jgi:hypothetical protein
MFVFVLFFCFCRTTQRWGEDESLDACSHDHASVSFFSCYVTVSELVDLVDRMYGGSRPLYASPLLAFLGAGCASPVEPHSHLL